MTWRITSLLLFLAAAQLAVDDVGHLGDRNGVDVRHVGGVEDDRLNRAAVDLEGQRLAVGQIERAKTVRVSHGSGGRERHVAAQTVDVEVDGVARLKIQRIRRTGNGGRTSRTNGGQRRGGGVGGDGRGVGHVGDVRDADDVARRPALAEEAGDGESKVRLPDPGCGISRCSPGFSVVLPIITSGMISTLPVSST